MRILILVWGLIVPALATAGSLVFYANAEGETYDEIAKDLSATHSAVAQRRLTNEEFGAMLPDTLAAAVHLSKFPIPEHGPAVSIVVNGYVKALVGCMGNCGVMGYYDPNTKTVYFEEDILGLPKVYAGGLMVHEFTHYLQYINGKKFETCEERRDAEMQAYHVQHEYLVSLGETPSWAWPNHQCGAQEVHD